MRDVNLLTSNGIDVEKSLELFGDMNMYDATLKDFLDGAPTKLNFLNKYKNSGDMTNYTIYAHSLKSDAKYLGFTHLTEIAYDHELKGKSNDLYYITNHYNELNNETKRILELVKIYLGAEGILETKNKDSNNNETGKILVADDSNIIRNFVKQIFSDKYDVICASDGKQAIEEIKKGNISCLLLDLNMSNINGFKVLEYLKEHDLFKTIPVSIITGEEDKSTIDKAKSYPIVDILFKPFNPKNIKMIVKRTINRG